MFQILKNDFILDIVIFLLISLLITVSLCPFLNALAISFSNASDSSKGNIYLWPREFTLNNYKKLLGSKQILQASFISGLRVILSTLFGTFFTAMVAYTISRKEFILRKPVTILYLLTMYINSGLIPTYFLIRSLGLTNNFLVYIIPGLISTFNLIIVRAFINRLDESIVESARMSGAGEFAIFLRIILPLSMPVLATIALFVAVSNWNSWFDTFLYNSSNLQLSTLQFELMKVIQIQRAGLKLNGLRATMVIIVTIPVIIICPFFQRYYIKALTLDGIKK